MFDRLPPLQTLRAFEAAARHLSMSLAAQELHVTHGAISRHIKTLEAHLGTPLFLRLTRKIVLTEAGAAFHVAVTGVLGDLTREAERLRDQGTAGRLRISTSVSFASKWLAPRLQRLRTRHPEFDVHLDVTDINVDLNDGQVDAAIRYGHGRYPRVSAERIMEETVTHVCSAAYREGAGGLNEVADIRACVLLHEDRMSANWEQWLALAGLDRRLSHRGPSYSHGSMTIEAAIRGEGVALGRSVLVAEDIQAGRLIAPFPDIRLKAEKGYDLVYAPANAHHHKVAALRAWLRAEIGSPAAP
ncbi:transcriptional regulator GcvA [Pseudomonadota bacterium AL_CKDN230030165-1A_HGKHYDSX7]